MDDQERRAVAEAGMAVFADRVILDARPPVDDETLVEVALRCAGPLPEPLVALWRTSFGGRLDYDLRADIDGQDEALSFTELFYPGSDDYHDLWGWIDHERELAGGRPLDHLPIGGFEYLDRVYVRTAPGPDHGAVVCWRQGLPAGWELRADDRVGRLAGDLPALFVQLALERDPWESDDCDSGEELRDAIDNLADPLAETLRDLVRATVLDWRGALADGTLVTRRRLRRLALERAAADDDVALLDRLESLGCDLAEEVRAGLTPIDVAVRKSSWSAVRWLLDRRVPVENTLRAGAHTVDLDLAGDLLGRGAAVNHCAVTRALDNADVEVVHLLAARVGPDGDLGRLGPRARTLAVQAANDGDTGRAAALIALANRWQAPRAAL